MNKEKQYLLIMLIFLLMLVVFSIFISVLFDDVYVSLLNISLLCMFFFIILLLYLRIQHNIDSKIGSKNVQIVTNLNRVFERLDKNKQDIAKTNSLVEHHNELIRRCQDSIEKSSGPVEKSDQITEECKMLIKEQEKSINELIFFNERLIGSLDDFKKENIKILRQVLNEQKKGKK